MTEVARPVPSWLAYISPRCLPSTPARARVAWALLADPRRSNRTVAREAGADHTIVRHVRHGLEAMAVIPVYRAPSRPLTRPPAPEPTRIARLALAADPLRPNREIASLAGCSEQWVMRVRWRMEAAGQIPVWRGRWPGPPRSRVTMEA